MEHEILFIRTTIYANNKSVFFIFYEKTDRLAREIGLCHVSKDMVDISSHNNISSNIGRSGDFILGKYIPIYVLFELGGV